MFPLQADLAYGSKMQRIKSEAENIMQYERDLIAMPGGLPSLASIDAALQSLQVRAQGGGGDVIAMPSELPSLASINAAQQSLQVRATGREGEGEWDLIAMPSGLPSIDAARQTL